MCVVQVREFEGHVSPSLLRRLLNGSCAPGAGSAYYTNLNPSESVCCPRVLVCLLASMASHHGRNLYRSSCVCVLVR